MSPSCPHEVSALTLSSCLSAAGDLNFLWASGMLPLSSFIISVVAYDFFHSNLLMELVCDALDDITCCSKSVRTSNLSNMLLFWACKEPAEPETELDREETCLLNSSALSDIFREIWRTVSSTLCRVIELARLMCLQLSPKSCSCRPLATHRPNKDKVVFILCWCQRNFSRADALDDFDMAVKTLLKNCILMFCFFPARSFFTRNAIFSHLVKSREQSSTCMLRASAR